MKYTVDEIELMRVIVRDMITPINIPYYPDELDGRAELQLRTYMANGTTLEDLRRYRRDKM